MGALSLLMEPWLVWSATDQEETALRWIIDHQLVSPFQEGTFDIYAEVSEYIPWINLTILINGGMDSCGYTLEGEPTFGKHSCTKKL